jgi:hypothetical protein
MTGPEHYLEAEICSEQGANAVDRGESAEAAGWLALAQVHATLALAAAVARLGLDRVGTTSREWTEAIGEH